MRKLKVESVSLIMRNRAVFLYLLSLGLLGLRKILSPRVSSSSSSYIVISRSSAISKGARRAPQDTKMDFAVLPETICQGLFNHFFAKIEFLLILLNICPYHSFNFFCHSFGCVLAEMNLDYVCHTADFLFYGNGILICVVFFVHSYLRKLKIPISF